jgi:hypothetical protein
MNVVSTVKCAGEPIVVLKELASWLGWMEKLSFYLGLDAHWLDVFIL